MFCSCQNITQRKLSVLSKPLLYSLQFGKEWISLYKSTCERNEVRNRQILYVKSTVTDLVFRLLPEQPSLPLSPPNSCPVTPTEFVDKNFELKEAGKMLCECFKSGAQFMAAIDISYFFK